MMKKKLFIHIGRPKVGSSAIQHFLWKNRNALLNEGILYPESIIFQKASHKLALIFQPYLADASVVHDETASSLYSQINQEADRASVSKLVVSSENYFLINPKEPAKYLREHFDVKIICYLRRQDEVLVSSLIQEIKAGAEDMKTDIQAYIKNPDRLALLDYEAVLDRWAKEFGQENIFVRVYEPEKMRGNIFQDFCSVIGVNFEKLVAIEERLNPSPALDVLNFIYQINQTSQDGIPKRQLRLPLLGASEKLGFEGGFDAKSIIPYSLKKQLLDMFRESNANVARKYLAKDDGILFSELDKEERVDSYSGYKLDRFVVMAATLFAFQQQQIHQLRSKVESLEENSDNQEPAKNKNDYSPKKSLAIIEAIKRKWLVLLSITHRAAMTNQDKI